MDVSTPESPFKSVEKRTKECRLTIEPIIVTLSLSFSLVLSGSLLLSLYIHPSPSVRWAAGCGCNRPIKEMRRKWKRERERERERERKREEARWRPCATVPCAGLNGSRRPLPRRIRSLWKESAQDLFCPCFSAHWTWIDSSFFFVQFWIFW